MVMGVAAVMMAGFSFLQFVCGYGLWTLKSYGRTIQLVFAWIGLLGIPIGTVISILMLVYLNKPGIKTLFSGRSAGDLTPQEWADVDLVAKGSVAVVIIAAVVVVVGGVMVMGIVAAIAVPGLLRARVAGNEASAIGTLRALLSAEVAYSVSNGGAYARPECLVEGAACNAAAGAPAFIDSSFSSQFEKSGYRFAYEGSREGFVFYATPVVPASTGIRSFCTTEASTICSISDGPLQPEGGRCPSSCVPLF
jgi:hypothetical protein